MNNVSLMGRMTAAPEIRTTQSGVSVTSFTVAVNRSYVKAGEERQADFINCQAWRGTAEFICRNFGKGQMIALTGMIQTRNYQDKEGKNRKAVEVVADKVMFAGERKESPAPSNTDDDFTVIDDDEDLPF